MIFGDSAGSEIPSFDDVYRRYFRNVYNYVAFRINNHHDTEELVSLVFEKFLRNIACYNPDLPVEAWLIGIAKNQVTDYLRKKMRRHFVTLGGLLQVVSSGRQPDEIAVANENNRTLMLAMARLKDRERQVLSMKFATNLTHAEIANILGISTSNVGVTAHRALDKLRSIMKEDGE